MLRVREVDSFYGLSHVLHGVSLDINPSETVSLLGRNGAGKSTTLHSIMGIHRSPLPRGSITFEGKELIGMPPHRIMRRGISLVPEGREIFPLLSVLENIKIGHIAKKNAPDHWSFDAYLETVCNLFPVLGKRLKNKGSQLSGGEQQMLAIARILRAKMDLILLDEPTEGLAPLLVRSIGAIIGEIKNNGLTVLLIEQNTRFATEVADRHQILYGGKIVYSEDNAHFREDQEIQKRYLGV